MKKLISFVLLVCTVMLCFTSCGEDDEGEQVTGSGLSVSELKTWLSECYNEISFEKADSAITYTQENYFSETQLNGKLDENEEIVEFEIKLVGDQTYNYVTIFKSESELSKILSKSSGQMTMKDLDVLDLALGVTVFAENCGAPVQTKQDMMNILSIFYSGRVLTFGNWDFSAIFDSNNNTIIAKMVYNK